MVRFDSNTFQCEQATLAFVARGFLAAGFFLAFSSGDASPSSASSSSSFCRNLIKGHLIASRDAYLRLLLGRSPFPLWFFFVVALRGRLLGALWDVLLCNFALFKRFRHPLLVLGPQIFETIEIVSGAERLLDVDKDLGGNAAPVTPGAVGWVWSAFCRLGKACKVFRNTGHSGTASTARRNRVHDGIRRGATYKLVFPWKSTTLPNLNAPFSGVVPFESGIA